MGPDNELNVEGELSFSEATGSDLRGRQSIRATFKLSAGCIDAISIVAKHLGIKQKSLFDHLAEDTRSLSSIAREAREARLPPLNRVQKTFVISRRSLNSLETVSKHYNAPRDALVEYSVKRLLPVILAERKKHEARKQVLDELNRHFQAGLALRNRIETKLGEEDPTLSWMTQAMQAYQNAIAQISDFVEKGKIIEEFDPESLGLLFKQGEAE
ncbi:MAG: hypothetical protein RBT11_02965 [Desulfobacterales bacterium]|jgi:hypothetical protein|nr:hypothetical protein [Desulfobacterales bacterium]